MAKPRKTKHKIVINTGGHSRTFIDAALEFEIADYSNDDNFLPGTKATKGENDKYNILRYLAKEIGPGLKGYKKAFEKADFFILTMVFEPSTIEFGKLNLEQLQSALNPKARSEAVLIVRRMINEGKLKYKRKTLTLRHVELLVKLFDEIFSPTNPQFAAFQEEFLALSRNEYQHEVISKMDIPDSLYRGGGGGGTEAGGAEVGEDKEVKPRKGKFKMEFKGGSAHIHEGWERIKKILRSPPTIKKITAGKKTIFTISTLSTKGLLDVRVQNVRSRFNSIYLMAEFGTGTYALFPRRYKSEKATPFKVRPQWINALDGATSESWISVYSAIREVFKRKKWASTYYTFIQTGNVDTNDKGYAKLLERRRAKMLERFQNISKFVLGKADQTSIKPHGMLFDKRGMVKEVRQGYKRWLRYVENLIHQYMLRFASILAAQAASPETKALSADLVKVLDTKKFVKFNLPDSVFDAVSYKKILNLG